MELVKIEYPDKSLLPSEEETLTEEQCDKLFNDIKADIDSDSLHPVALKEMDDESAVYLGMAVGVIIFYLIKWIKNKYSLNCRKMIDQAKELNDIWVKVDYMLKHDKMARFKHRNDHINTTYEQCVLRDKKDPRKIYQVTVDYIAYDPEYFMNEIDEIMRYVNEKSKDKSADLQSMKESLLERIDQNFTANHAYIIDLEPMLRKAVVKNVRLEDALMNFKGSIDVIYQNLYYMNKFVASELQYMQVLDKAYKRMLGEYGKDKESKKMIDEIFKKLLKNISLSLDYNNSIMTIYNEEIRYYLSELERVYEIIRS